MKISVIIPTYNESACIPQTLAAVRALPGDFEIIVVDGGSEDGTIQQVKEAGLLAISKPGGRAAQMNYGAALAQGEVLLFLHADTQLPENAHALISVALFNTNVVGGCFRLGFDYDHYMLHFFAFFTRYSFPLWHYGDQAYFLRVDVFRKLGGFKSYPLMEDIDLWLRLRRLGKVIVLPKSVKTSARRFLRNGVLRQMLFDGLLVILFLCGVAPHKLKRFYREVR